MGTGPNMKKHYESLPTEEDETQQFHCLKYQPKCSLRRKILVIAMYILVTVLVMASFITNACLIYQRYAVPWELAARLPSRFAHLRHDIPVEIVARSHFSSTNRTIQDEAWNDPNLEPWSLFLALDDKYSVSMGLPSSQRWPWDTHKGAYIPMGAHELHCVRVLRSVINENHDRLPESRQTWPYAHAMHCLDVLRETVVCHADDTPMYTGRLHKNVFEEHPRAGVGTVKMCRDWSALVSWARERSACYRPVHGFEDFDEIERYKFCPDNSTPWKDASESNGS